MDISLTVQATAFFGAMALGLGAGLVYDLFRLLHRRLHLPLLGSILDLLFWISVTTALFVFTITVGRGELRFFMIVALFLGAVTYFLTLSPLALFLGGLVADAIARFLHILTRPVVWFHLLCKKIGQITKNHFHYWAKWFNIRKIPEEMERLTRIQRSREEGGRRRADKKSGIFDQNRGSSPADLHGHVAAESSGPTSQCRGTTGRSEQTGHPPNSGKRGAGRRRRPQRRPPAD